MWTRLAQNTEQRFTLSVLRLKACSTTPQPKMDFTV